MAECDLSEQALTDTQLCERLQAEESTLSVLRLQVNKLTAWPTLGRFTQLEELNLKVVLPKKEA